MEEKELIEKACKGFEKEYSSPPQKVGMECIKVWHKIMPFYTMKCIVFAPNWKIADRFTFIQNAIWGSISYFWVLIPLFIIAFFCAFAHQNIAPLVALVYICFAFMIFYFVLSVIGKKWEKEYIGNIIVCYADNLECLDEDIEEDI